MTEQRLMPNKLNFGSPGPNTMGELIFRWEKLKDREMKQCHFDKNKYAYREVLGFFLPPWQRGFVWTDKQKVKFLESAWLGIPLGTFSFNQTRTYDGPMNNLLIDGQQRINAIECYLNDEFPVFGYRWSEVNEIDRRSFDSRIFASYITTSTDEVYLRNYYNLMNFGGTSHDGEKRA